MFSFLHSLFLSASPLVSTAILFPTILALAYAIGYGCAKRSARITLIAGLMSVALFITTTLGLVYGLPIGGAIVVAILFGLIWAFETAVFGFAGYAITANRPAANATPA